MTKYTELKEKYKGKRIILHVASYLSPMKGTDYAIEAMGYVNKEFPDAWLLIITSERDDKRIQELYRVAYKANFTQIIWEFNVKDEDMPAYYSLVECLLAPSLDENVHLPELEAQSCECPVIMFQGKMDNESVVNWETGLLVRKNVDDLSQAVKFLLKIDEDRIDFGKNAHKFILDNFTWNKCIESYNRIIKEVV